MNKRTFAVTGATGRVGTQLTVRLLSAGHAVRAIGRDEEKLEALARRGAETHAGSLHDVGFLKAIFKGAHGVFAMVPPDYGSEHMFHHQRSVTDVETAAIRAAGVPRVVALSSVGAELESGTGLIGALHYHEQTLNGLEADVISLRCGYFMENLLAAVEMIHEKEVHADAFEPDVALPMIATKDVAAAAAAHLAGDSRGKIVEHALGPCDVTQLEATRILGNAIGMPDLLYVQLAYEDMRTALLANGMSGAASGAMVEMIRAFNDGIIRPTVARSPRNSTPTSLEQWARSFALAYRESPSAVHAGRRGT